jgi:hypothetical protein
MGVHNRIGWAILMGIAGGMLVTVVGLAFI